MAAASLTLIGNKTGLASGSEVIGPLVVSNTAAPVDAVSTLVLSSGNNTITVPTGAIAALLIPPIANAVALILKGVNGDTGVSLGLTTPTLISLAAAQTTFVVNAGSNVTVVVQWI